MTGLLVFGVAGLYVALCVFIARALALRTSSQLARWVIYAIGLPIVVAAPLADEIIGKYQFDKLCREAAIEIRGTLPAGEELYTADGEWRLATRSLPLEQYKQIEAAYKSLVRDENFGPKKVPAVIPIRMYEHRIHNNITGEILASYQHYASSGVG